MNTANEDRKITNQNLTSWLAIQVLIEEKSTLLLYFIKKIMAEKQ